MCCFMPLLLLLCIHPFLSVFCVGSFWPCLQQQYYSDWSGTVQQSAGPVQPPSHSPGSLHMRCASHRSVPVWWTALLFQRHLNSYDLVSPCWSLPGNLWNTSPFLFTQAFLSCSVRWRCRNCMDWNSGRKVVSADSTAHFIKRRSHLFFPLSSSDCLCLTVYLYTQPLLAGETVCSQFSSQKVFIHSRELPPLCVMFLF